MNPDTMTLTELRDWHATNDGWEYMPNKYVPDSKVAGYWFHPTIENTEVGDHPFPATLDGADAAFPKGWWWQRDGGTEPNPEGLLLKWSAMQIGRSRWAVVMLHDTGDEITDRYRLAMKAKLAEKESKHGN
jgi:hypothetical protein